MGIRIIKTALAAIAAIYTAVYLGLEPPLGAGILAIICVEVTRMKGLKSAFVRFIASVLGLFFASLVFSLLGFHIWAVAIFVLITFSVLSRFQLKEGIVTSSVIVFHLFDYGKVTVQLIGNEIMLLVVGLGWATIINLIYMPKDEHRLVHFRSEIERCFSVIFMEMSHTLRDPAHLWDGNEILEAYKAIEAGTAQSNRSKENRLWRQQQYWPSYYVMRQQQLESIQQMLVELALIYQNLPQSSLVAELFEQLAADVKSEVYEGLVEEKLFSLFKLFRKMELPRSRDEFEMRAALHMLLHELNRFLEIAKRLKKRKAAMEQI